MSVSFEGIDLVQALFVGDLEDFTLDLVAVRGMTVAKVGQVGHDQFAQFGSLGLAKELPACTDHDVMVRAPALERAVYEYFNWEIDFLHALNVITVKPIVDHLDLVPMIPAKFLDDMI